MYLMVVVAVIDFATVGAAALSTVHVTGCNARGANTAEFAFVLHGRAISGWELTLPFGQSETKESRRCGGMDSHGKRGGNHEEAKGDHNAVSYLKSRLEEGFVTGNLKP
jgi:hypothetical protein